MTLQRLIFLRDTLTLDDDIAKITIDASELSEIFQYQLKLLNAWGREYTYLETINVMIADLQNPRVLNVNVHPLNYMGTSSIEKEKK